MFDSILKAIPEPSPVYQTLDALVKECKIVIFSGLPGVGKSLYVNAFQALAKKEGKKLTLIQWDVARKAFETEDILSRFPMGDGTVHNGLKLIAGKWLMDEVEMWIDIHAEDSELLLIEAPLVGHRFIELVQQNASEELEQYLSSDEVQVVMPIPTNEVRSIIEEARAKQVKEEAKVWSGAKPSVMLMLWKMTCGIAVEFGKEIDMDGQPPYDPEIYSFVFSEILKHRHFVPLIIDEVFSLPEMDESMLHDNESLKADPETAAFYAELVNTFYSEQEIEEIVSNWYLT